jgi:thioesterase domain-containing protein
MECTMLIHPSFGASTKHFLGCLLSGCRQSVPSVTNVPIDGGDLLYGTPSQIQAKESELSQSKGFSLISLTGEACSSRGWEVIRAISSPGAKCLNALGGTETGVLINSLTDIQSAIPQESSLRGRGLPGKHMAVIGDDQKPVPKGTPGLLRVESEWIAEGYLDRESGGDRFHPFPKSDTGRVFLTGDVVVEEEGTLHLLGRSGAMIKHRGAWIDTSPLHNALQAEGIGEIHLDKAGERDALRVWMRMESPDRELLRKVASRLEQIFSDSPLLPEIVVGIGKFPLNSNGKKDLRELARLAESGEVITEKIPTRVERLASILVNEEWDSRLLKGARRIGDLELDSLSLHELLLELERLSEKAIPLWKMQPATTLTEILRTSGELPQAFGRLEGKVGAPVLLWMGDGVTGIRHDLGNQVTILHWNVSALPGALGTKNVSTMRELVERLIGMLDSKDLSGRIVIGGFSAGAVLAHEVALVLSDRGTPPSGLLLLDPPDLDYRPIRTPWRWSRWRPSIVCRLLGVLPDVLLDASNGKLRDALANETQKHVRERRRKLLRNYHAVPTTLPAVLATSGSHREGALRGFAHISEKLEMIPLGVEHHTEVMSNAVARSLWVPRLRGFLFGS